MALAPVDDAISIEELPEPTSGLYVASDSSRLVRVKVLDCGPGAIAANGTRMPMPCTVGDTLLVRSNAGFRFRDAGTDYWFVRGNGGEVVAVVEGGRS